MKYKLIAGLLISLTAVSGLLANSVFSFEGFPVQDYNNDVFSLGLGGSGIGDTFRRNTGFINPSLTTTLNQVYFSTGITTGYYYYKDEERRFRDDGVHFPYFNITIPLANHRIGFNYSSYLSGNKDVYIKDKVWDEEDLSYTEINRVRSYVYRGSLIYGFKSSLLNVGASFDYLLGHRLRSWKQEYGREAGSFEDPWYEKNEAFSNYGFSLGVNRSFGDFSVGSFYRSPVTLEGDTELLTRHEVFDLGESEFETPSHFGMGFAWRISDIYRLTSDVHYELWSQTDSYDEPEDTYKLSLGLAYEPLWRYEEWYRKIPLRAGGYYRTLPFKAKGEAIDEWAATLGITIPLQAPNSQLDFAIKYISRGDVNRNHNADESIVLSIGLSGFDFFSSRKKKIEEREIPEAEYESFR